MSNKYTAVKMTPDGIVIYCTKELQCWKTGECQLAPSYAEKCLVQKADNFRVWVGGKITPNTQTLWRRLYPRQVSVERLGKTLSKEYQELCETKINPEIKKMWESGELVRFR